jgi:hypothetical protein
MRRLMLMPVVTKRALAKQKNSTMKHSSMMT